MKKNLLVKKNLLDMAMDLSEILPTDEVKPDEKENPNKSVQVKKTVNRHAMRRVLSELALEKELPAVPVNRFEGCSCRGATLRDFQDSINAALLQFERKGMALVRINMVQVETGGYMAFLTFEPEY